MTATAEKQELLVKNTYPGAKWEECKRCGYLLRCLPWMKASEGGKYAGVCICAKTGEGTGPACQNS